MTATTSELIRIAPESVNVQAWVALASKSPEDLRAATCSFLDTIATATGRASHYRTVAEQDAAETAVHNALYNLDRGLYASLLLFPGIMDRARMKGFETLLARASDRSTSPSLVSADTEAKILSQIAQTIEPQRMIKVFGELRKKRVNNARARKIVLYAILRNENLDWWSVKYRAKIRSALEHAWGKRLTGILRAILAKGTQASLSVKERSILRDTIDRYASTEKGIYFTRECVSFILGNEGETCSATPEIIESFIAAKSGDAKKLAKLPLDTQEGLRGRYLKSTVSRADLLKKADKADVITDKQRMKIQASAEAAGVEVRFDPNKQDAVSLYIYAFERGMDAKIEEALAAKAKKAAEILPGKFRRVGILVDCSRSMIGHATQKLRPMAVALATRDMLAAGSEDNVVRYCGGEKIGKLLRKPKGDTTLAEGLVELFEEGDLDGIFILTDGYENAPAGRVAEVLGAARRLGISTPVTQLSPVFAGETQGLRFLAGDKLPAYPLQRPEGLGTTLVRDLLEQNPARGIARIVTLCLSQIGTKAINAPKKRKKVAA